MCFYRARSYLDYDYHTRPTHQRQHLQDAILRRYLHHVPSTDPPRIIFLAGAMGAGKGHVLRELHRVGRINLSHFVLNDSDQLKSEIPEASDLIRTNPLMAATLLHTESSFLSDVLMWAALLRGYSTIIEGTLKDSDWFLQLFAQIRIDFPAYRIEILYVTADPHVIRERCARRALQTQRYIPDSVIDDALLRVPDSVRRLTPLVDLVTHVSN
jgi:hypothetical protein